MTRIAHAAGVESRDVPAQREAVAAPPAPLPVPEDLDQREADLRAVATLPADDPERALARSRVVEAHLPLVRHLARRYTDRGEPFDDLVQVGTIGLLKAVDRFDPGHGAPFGAYAVPTVLGEIRRHFRDRGWAVRVPRRLQELTRTLTEARAELTQALGRAPTVDELAERVGIDVDTVLEALESAGAYATVPLEGESEETGPVATLAEDDAGLELVENREALRPLLAALPPRERRILALRFVRGLTQQQIAAEVGISQMHVSRLLSRTLRQLRTDLVDDAG